MVELTGEDLAHLTEFRARLSATRPAKSRSNGWQALAVNLGAQGIAGIAPVLFRRKSRGERSRAEVAVGVGFTPNSAPVSVVAETSKAVSDTIPPLQGFRVVLEAARQEAAQVRARCEHERVADYLPSQRAQVAQRAFAPVGPHAPTVMPRVVMREPGLLAAPAFAQPGRVHALAAGRGKHGLRTLPLEVASSVAHESVEAKSENLTPAARQPAGRENTAELGQALRAYFFRQSRLPPSGGTGFDPRLTPLWAGVKIPG